MQELGHTLEITRNQTLTDDNDVITSCNAFMVDPAIPDCELYMNVSSSVWYSCTMDNFADREYAADMTYALFYAILQAEGTVTTLESMDDIAAMLGRFFEEEQFPGSRASTFINGYLFTVLFSNDFIKVSFA